MRRIALYSDIHANLPALGAVAADIEAHGVSERYCLGDLVGYGPHPSETIARMRVTGDPVVRGNYDAAICSHHATPGSRFVTPQETLDGAESYAFTVSSLTGQDVSFLAELPETIAVEVDGVHLLFCHGSPRRVDEMIEEDAPSGVLASHIARSGADAVCCGHVHVPFHRSIMTARGVLHWVNAGSVGRPRDGDPRAAWVEVAVGSRDEVLAFASADVACRRVRDTDVWLGAVSHRVAYDVESTARDMMIAGLPSTLSAGLRIGLEEHDWEAAAAERAAADAASAAKDDLMDDIEWQNRGQDEKACTCVIDERTAAYEALARLFRGDVYEVAVAIRQLRTSMQRCRVARTVDEEAVRDAFHQADRAIRTEPGRKAFLKERERLFGVKEAFDPFTHVLSPNETTYLGEDPAASTAVLELLYKESSFTIPAIGGVARPPGDIASELSFMGHCLRMVAVGDADAIELARRFFVDHLSRWAVLFAVVVGREAKEPVCRYAGLALDKLLTCEAATFRHSIPDMCALRQPQR